ncbi:MAG: glycosyltransferase family 39 protein [Vicinamibacterales bacterium]
MVSSRAVPGRFRSALAVFLFCALLAAAVRLVGVPLSRTGPSTAMGTDDVPISVPPGSTFEQTFFVPACTPDHVDVFLGATAGGTRVSLTVVPEQAAGVDDPDALTLRTEEGQPSVRIAVAPSGDTWRRTFVLHGRVMDGPPLVLRTTRPPFDWRGTLRLDNTWLGRRALVFETAAGDTPLSGWRCAFDRTGTSRSALALSALLLLLGVISIVIAGVVVPAPGGARGHRWCLAPFTAALSAGFVWLAVVPAYEGPDEVAHFQYARFVALEGALPSGPPREGARWTNHFYEWVQPPLFYVLSAATLRLTGTAQAEPVMRLNPASTLQGGIERSLYRHAEPDRESAGRSAFDLLRAVSWLMMGLTVLIVARSLSKQAGDFTLAAAAAAALPLVPQWSAVLTTVSNDSLATLLATLAAAILLWPRGADDPSFRPIAAGVLCGLALSTKLTTAFLLPMGFAAVLFSDSRRRLAEGGLMFVGVLIAAGWVFARNLWVFGDPLAADFKRAILDRSGFVALSHVQPSVTDAAFWTGLRGQLFEAFWARFGSLGVGPTPGSRLWWFYGACTGAVLVFLAVGFWIAAHHVVVRRQSTSPSTVVAACGTATGITFWLAVNLAGLEDVVVHWTPRHLLPLSLPALSLAVAGLRGLRQHSVARPWRPHRLAGGVFLLLLVLAWLASLRHVIAQFHFGTV